MTDVLKSGVETVMSKMDQSGRILIPAAWRNRMNLPPGTEVVLGFDEGTVVVLGTRADGVKRAQALIRKYIPEGRKLSEELVQERRDEAAREP
ncbi:MAG: AbrB/MazE/SpoVT family DNA-binding domain-containing protein [Bryobacteraceae bacterium]